MSSSVRVEGVEDAGTDELVARYARAARRHGHATLEETHVGNSDADEIAAIYRELRTRGKQATLLALLDVNEPSVQVWVAAHALEFAPEEGEPVLARLAKDESVLGFTAKVTLDEWRDGRLRFP